MEELRNASEKLKFALERYLEICTTISSRFDLDLTLGNVSDTILDELQAIVAYETYFDRSKKAIGKLRNYCTKIVPVNRLPPELLTRVFYFAREIKCIHRPNPPSHSLFQRSPKPSIFLTHVCSYWRSIALCSHALWTHIDILLFSPHEQRSLDGSKFLVSHSGDLPLELHVLKGHEVYHRFTDDTLDLCTITASRAKIVDLCLTGTPSNDAPVIGSVFSNCVPRQLTRLSLRLASGSTSVGFVVAHDTTDHSIGSRLKRLTIEVSHHDLEEVLRHVTDLYLDSTYLSWNSLAYSGLVRLRLDESDPFGRCITTFQLVLVLTASPQLRFFRFECMLASDRRNPNPSPVRLDQLESFHLESETSTDHDSVLRLIIPGSRPLHMTTITYANTILSLTEGEHRRFFERSNIVQLHAAGMNMSSATQRIPIHELLNLAPNLRSLSVDGMAIEAKPKLSPQTNSGHQGAQFSCLRLKRYRIGLDELKSVIDKYPITELIIDPKSCDVRNGDDASDVKRASQKCPSLSFVYDGNPNEVDWD